jgi:hypothetical protein
MYMEVPNGIPFGLQWSLHLSLYLYLYVKRERHIHFSTHKVENTVQLTAEEVPTEGVSYKQVHFSFDIEI